MIDPKWPLPGTVDFRRLIEEKYEFLIADALHCFWPIGCNLSGNPYLSAKEVLNLDLGDNKLLLIGCDEERIAYGTYMIDNTFRRCISHFIKGILPSNTCDTLVPTVSLPNVQQDLTIHTCSSNHLAIPTYSDNPVPSIMPTSYQHLAPTIPPTSSNIKPAIPTCPNSSVLAFPPTPCLNSSATCIAPTVLQHHDLIVSPTSSNIHLLSASRTSNSMPTPSRSNSSTPTPSQLNSHVPTIVPSSHPYQSGITNLNYQNDRIVIPLPALLNKPATLTPPLVLLHHAPTVPPTSANILSFSVPCPISSMPTPTYPLSSSPTIPPIDHSYQLPTSTNQTFFLHKPPTMPPTSSNIKPFFATNLTNSMLTVVPTSSNAQPFVPTYSDKSAPTTSVTNSSMSTSPSIVHLHQAPTEPPTTITNPCDIVMINVPHMSPPTYDSPAVPPRYPSHTAQMNTKIPALAKLETLETEITSYLSSKIENWTKQGWNLGTLQFVNHFYGSSPSLKSLNPCKFLLQNILTSVLENKIELSLSLKPTRWMMETLKLPFCSCLKDTHFNHIINAARKAIPPGLRERLTINIEFDNPIPLGFLLENNSFSKMSLEERLDEQSICHCFGRDEFKAIPNCDHIITTDPKLLENDFPILFDLCKNGAKYRVQTKKITTDDIYEAIDSFRDRMNHKYRLHENELQSFNQILKSLITPYLIDLDCDVVPNIKPELMRLHKM